ncbi:hypothetical protein EVAR_6570_1 [Eumeta japonica]|uniref:Uncharacterized protein n=1 Tax=Eumeta variegata TaxID=151549 RepID=A0A4C1SQG7_EUMVA|nr:hypothetical protein EVAR_6570_1 [Eumeta japonica]
MNFLTISQRLCGAVRLRPSKHLVRFVDGARRMGTCAPGRAVTSQPALLNRRGRKRRAARRPAQRLLYDRKRPNCCGESGSSDAHLGNVCRGRLPIEGVTKLKVEPLSDTKPKLLNIKHVTDRHRWRRLLTILIGTNCEDVHVIRKYSRIIDAPAPAASVGGEQTRLLLRALPTPVDVHGYIESRKLRHPRVPAVIAAGTHSRTISKRVGRISSAA